MTTATVVVPSYRRPVALRRCLAALAAQERAPDQVVVAVHAGDVESAAVVEEFERVECVTASDRRVVSLMKAAVERASGEVVAITDDDARPHPDWLGRLLAVYAPGVGGVGGRDLIEEAGAPTERVGLVEPTGRLVYSHHRGHGPARDVDVLKGVNMSLRRELWRLDESLRGSGDQVHWELDLCLRARAEGWRLVYDPSIVVDHPRERRVDGDPRGALTFRAVRDSVHNELYAVLRWSPSWRRMTAAVYGLLVGHRNAPGPLLVPERIARERQVRSVLTRAAAGALGRLLALRTAAARLRAGRSARAPSPAP